MREYLKDVPAVSVSQRRLEPTFPRGAKYFRSWRTLRWYVVLLLPVIASAVTCHLRNHEIVAPLAVGFLGAMVAAALFVSLASGTVSSNHGTHYRSSEPVRYSLQILVLTAFYLFLLGAGYFG